MRPPAPDADTAAAELVAIWRDALQSHTFGKLVLAKRRPVRGDVASRADKPIEGDDLKRVAVRLIRLRNEPMLSFVYSYATRDVTRNVAVADGIACAEQLIATTFSHAHLATRDEVVEWRLSRRGQQTVRRSPAPGAKVDAGTQAAAGRDTSAEPDEPSTFFGLPLGGAGHGGDGVEGHDRARHRFVDIDAPYLAALGVTDAAHRLVPAMARKWRQINKFVEIVDHAIDRSGLADRQGEPIRVADFGCGKGYLTFAVHEHLVHSRRLEARTTGVELRPELVDAGNRAAAASYLDGLRFEAGDLRSHQPQALDVMIALHACDTATDHAIHLALGAGARVIVCSPCCHKELRPQMARPAARDGVLRHGVHLGQQAEMVTDSLRALLLEAEGYDAQVFEFIALEHTSKNKMILAVKRADAVSPKALAAAAAARDEIARVKSFYAIGEQRLETLRRESQDA